MERATELQLIQRCQELSSKKTTTLSASQSSSDTSRYVCPRRFDLELEKLHKAQPFLLAHSSEVAEKNSFIARQTQLGNLIVSRDGDGKCHVFHNICRHRGATLVSSTSSSGKRISCPYHAWSYTTDGKLASVPGQTHCFPNLDKGKNSLLAVPSVEKYGFIWVCPQAREQPEQDLDGYLEGAESELTWLQAEKLTLYQRQSRVWHANWKIFAEGGLETYHFSYAHRETIGPDFLNNTAVIDVMGNHLRIVMPTKSLTDVAAQPLEKQHIRACTHILYSLLPTSVLLVQQHHIDWIFFRPVATDMTEISIASLVPTGQLAARQEHWQRNHEITLKVLAEDFVLGEGIQASMSSGVMQHINYGRNEWALKCLNEWIDRFLQE